jgi:hypothetical protein
MEYKETTYHFHEIGRVLANPSRHYGRVQWVFSGLIQTLPFAKTQNQRGALAIYSSPESSS